MSKGFRGGNGEDIRDHLSNHIHLTNCIHLKNHLHNKNKRSRILADRTLLRDLVALQRSKPLKDPYTSAVDVSLTSREVERPKVCRRKSKSENDRKKVKRGECPSRWLTENNVLCCKDTSPQCTVDLPNCIVSGQHELRSKKKIVRAPSNQIRDFPSEPNLVASSCNHGRRSRVKKTADTQGTRRSRRPSIASLDAMSVASNSFSQGSVEPDRIRTYLEEFGLSSDDLQRREVTSQVPSDKLRKQLTYGHQNLTQKYMPRTFEDLVGQSFVAQVLSNAIAKRKVGLLYVFYGPHGTGKTTCARIFAKALNCRSPESPKPCGSCNSCIADNSGKSRNVTEVTMVRNLDFNAIELFRNLVAPRHHSRYRVFILDDCDGLSTDYWSAILKAVDRAPRHVVFILVCSCIDALPHSLISRCQKFYFPKVKDADIMEALQGIAAKEDLEIEHDALKLIASQSDGSLRDAEMTLEQLSLLGNRISLCLVQELIGLISDEKLVDLLDLALTADTVNTVKNLRDIMESRVEPLVLMSQLATVITDILAGSYDVLKDRREWKFFRQQTLSKDDMENLRQALRKLSEAEKQLRLSNDKMTWLTAAVLQLAPDEQPVSKIRRNDFEPCISLEEIWLQVLENIPISTLKDFIRREGKLVSLSHGTAAAVELLFDSHVPKSKVEELRSHIAQAFESVLKSPVIIKIKCGSTSSPANAESEPVEEEVTQETLSINQREGDVDKNSRLGIVRSKVSLAHIILQHTEGFSQTSGWLKHKAFSIAHKLEQQNLKLEARSKALLCWNPPVKISSRKISRLKIRGKGAQMLRKSACYGRCLSGNSPRVAFKGEAEIATSGRR